MSGENMKKILPLLNICMKAGKLVSGEFACEESLRDKNAHLIIISGDASDNTKEKFTNKAFYYGVQTIILGEKEVLGKVIGKGQRSVISIIDEGFAEAFKKLI